MEYYNNDIKQEFIKTAKAKNIYKTLFKQLDLLQIYENNDIYNLPGDMIVKELMDKSAMHSLASLRSQYSKIVNYKEWAFINGYVDDDSVPFIHEKIDLKTIFLENNKLIFIRTPRELADLLENKLSYKIDGRTTTDDLLKVYYYLAYQGIHHDDVLNIKMSDIIMKENNIAIITKKEIIVIYEDFKKSFIHVYNNRIYESRSPRAPMIVEMGDRFISKGDCFSPKKMKFLFSQSSFKRLNGEPRIDDTYIMGCIYKIKQNIGNDDGIPYEKLLVEIFGTTNVNPLTKEKVYRYYEMW